MEYVRHLAWYFILTVRINHLAWCLRHFSPATPNRKNHQSFVQQSKFVFLVLKKGIFVPLLGVATLEFVRHLTVRKNHLARCLSHMISATPNRNKTKHFSETPNLYFFC